MQNKQIGVWDKMVQIAPFKGVLYNQKKLEHLGLVTAPPYDTISPQQQERLYKTSPYNVVRLILNKEPGDEKYRRAAECLRQWLAEGVLEQAGRPSLYIYEQKYYVPVAGSRQLMVRRGIMARAKLEDFSSGKILPHERTHKTAKADRMKLMQSCEANLCPIFSFYSDLSGVVTHYLDQITDSQAPLVDFKDEHDIEHLIWDIVDPKVIASIGKQLDKCPIFIADGHHRYETALAYRDWRRSNDPAAPQDAPYDYTMMMLVNMDEADLTILPIHRLIRHLKHFDLKEFIGLVEEYFDVERHPYPPAEEEESLNKLLAAMHHQDGRHRFGLYGGDNCLYLLTLKDKNILGQINLNIHSTYWKQLDVAVLHSVLIEHILQAGKQEWSEDHITYTIDPLQALREVDEGRYQLGIFLNPTKVEQVKEVARAGEKMPQKSTFFYPKLLSGLVINCFDE